MRRLCRILVKIALVGAGLWAAGLVAARRFERGSGAESDDFRVAAFWGGKALESTSSALRSGAAMTVCGGLDLDLRGATLHPGGARLTLHAVCGGIKVAVEPGWRVEVRRDVSVGEVEIETTDPFALPEDAPTLVVEVKAVLAGVLIAAES